MKCETDNANDSTTFVDGVPSGWFIGPFVEGATLRHSGDFELKWGIHSPGFESGIKPVEPIWGISILINGSLSLGFRTGPSEEWQEMKLCRQGDFVITNESGEHWYRTDEGCIVLTVRAVSNCKKT